MSDQRLSKLETQMEELQKVFYKIEASLENIEKSMSQALSVKDTVITHEEKHKVTENRLINLERESASHREGINGVNLKIAMATGVWASIMFALQYFISKM